MVVEACPFYCLPCNLVLVLKKCYLAYSFLVFLLPVSSFDNLEDAIEAVNARKGKMAKRLILPAHPSQYPPERGADIEIYSVNKNEKGHRTGHIIARIPTALDKKLKKGDDNGI